MPRYSEQTHGIGGSEDIQRDAGEKVHSKGVGRGRQVHERGEERMGIGRV